MYTQYFSLASTLIKRVHHLISCTTPVKTQKAILSPQCGGKIAFGFGGMRAVCQTGMFLVSTLGHGLLDLHQGYFPNQPGLDVL